MLDKKNITDKEKKIIPYYIYILSFIGIVFLFFSLITWFVFYFNYYQSYNNSFEETPKKKEGHDIFLALTSTLFCVGFILSSSIFYGLYKTQEHNRNCCQ